MYQKIIEGFVIQTFDNKGMCVSQRFNACNDTVDGSDVVVYHDPDGEEIDREDMPLQGREHHDMDMVQPTVDLQSVYKHSSAKGNPQ